MKKWMANNWLYVAGSLAGGIGGWLYWKFVGCTTGTCPITSKPLNSTLYFAVMGALFFSIFKKKETVAAVEQKKGDGTDDQLMS